MGSWTNATTDARGRLVHPQRQDRFLSRAEFPVADAALEPYVHHFWAVAWNRHAEPLETSEVITRPDCHLTFEDAVSSDGAPLVRHGVMMPAAVVTTVWTRRFLVRLEGEGRAFGAAFHPGALAALAGRALPQDQSLVAESVLPGASSLLPAVLAEPPTTSSATSSPPGSPGSARLRLMAITSWPARWPNASAPTPRSSVST